jgi:hypothetical protein
MAQYIIPKNAGPYRVISSRAGTPLVMNECNGKAKVRIPCKTLEQAEEICRQLNENHHDGIIRA